MKRRLSFRPEAEAQFVVIGEKDVVILKAISPPSMKDFDKTVSKARSQARKSGMKKSDVKQALSDTRAKR